MCSPGLRQRKVLEEGNRVNIAEDLAGTETEEFKGETAPEPMRELCADSDAPFEFRGWLYVLDMLKPCDHNGNLCPVNFDMGQSTRSRRRSPRGSATCAWDSGLRLRLEFVAPVLFSW